MSNWQKYKEDEWLYAGPGGFDKNNVTGIRIEYLPGKETPYKYEVYLIGKYTSHTVESFTSKSKALSFVKDYIKQNDSPWVSLGHIIFSQDVDLRTMYKRR